MSALAAAGAGVADLVQRVGTRLILAQPGDPDPDNGKGPEWGKAAPIGLLIIALLCIALFFLVKSMNKQFKKVPTSFGPAAAAPAVDTIRTVGSESAGAGSAGAGTVADDDAPGDVAASGGSAGSIRAASPNGTDAARPGDSAR